MVLLANTSNIQTPESRDLMDRMTQVKSLMCSPPLYGATSASGDTCPTCRGTGRIPRGQEDQLVAVIPCNDVRLKPRRTKLYMCISVVLSVCLCFLILFFLFPRSVTLTPVSVLSVMVYPSPDRVEMEVTNLINVTNRNFVPVHITEFSVQGLIADIVMGKKQITNMTGIPYHSQKSYKFEIDLLIFDKGLNTYCQSTSIKIHTLFLELQMTMDISYLSHTEQITVNTFEYVDCGKNTTTPHSVR